MPGRRTAGRCASWFSAPSAGRPSGRRAGAARSLGLAEDDLSLRELFGQPRGPEPRRATASAAAGRRWCPNGSTRNCRRWSARTNGRRCSNARRSTCASTPPGPRAMSCSAQFPEPTPTPLSPWGIRLPRRQPGRRPSRLRRRPGRGPGRGQPADRAGLRAAQTGERILDLCAGAGGKALALAAAAPGATILATDSNRARLSKLPPRAERAGRDDRNAAAQPAQRARANSTDWQRQGRRRAGRRALLGKRHLAAQSRRALAADARAARPAGRPSQQRLLDIAAELVRPGGRLVYAVCSLLSREGAGQIERFLSAIHRGLVRKRPLPPGVRMARAGC